MPLVELRTTHQQRFVTDNAGLIAFDLPELMGRETWFTVTSDGYEAPADGFGYRGVRLTPQPGETLTVEVNRTSIAKRLGRITGGGLFAESQKLGREIDWQESGVLGCDSVQNAVHSGRLFWAWGDTTLARYPLGIFDMTSATTPDAAARVIRAAVETEARLFHRRCRTAARRGQDAGRGADVAQRLREPARQERARAGWWRPT